MRNGRVGVMVRSETAWRFRASQGRGGDSTRLGSGSWSRGRVLGSKNPDGRGVGWSVWPTDLYSVVSMLSFYYCGRRERAQVFMFTLFSLPLFSVSYVLCASWTL